MPNGAWVVYILPCEKLEPKSLSHFIHLRSVFSSENCLAFFSAMDASINLPDCVAHYILYSLIWKWFALTYIIRHMYVQTASPRLSGKLGTEKCPDNQIFIILIKRIYIFTDTRTILFVSDYTSSAPFCLFANNMKNETGVMVDRHGLTFQKKCQWKRHNPTLLYSGNPIIPFIH